MMSTRSAFLLRGIFRAYTFAGLWIRKEEGDLVVSSIIALCYTNHRALTNRLARKSVAGATGKGVVTTDDV